jgi:hypothetical protein
MGCQPAAEVCNGADDSCNGAVDEGLPVGGAPWTPTDTFGRPHLASGGSGFALVLNHAALGLLFERRSPTGALLGATQLDTSTGDGAVAWNGSEWAACWESDAEIRFRRVSQSGVLQGAQDVTLETGSTVSGCAVAANGTGWVVATSKRVVLLDEDGVLTDAVPLIGSNPHIAEAGGGWVVAFEGQAWGVSAALDVEQGFSEAGFQATAIAPAGPSGVWVAGTDGVGAHIYELDSAAVATGAEWSDPGGETPALAVGLALVSGRLYRLGPGLEEVASFDALPNGVASMAAGPTSTMMVSMVGSVTEHGHIAGPLGCDSP